MAENLVGAAAARCRTELGDLGLVTGIARRDADRLFSSAVTVDHRVVRRRWRIAVAHLSGGRLVSGIGA